MYHIIHKPSGDRAEAADAAAARRAAVALLDDHGRHGESAVYRDRTDGQRPKGVETLTYVVESYPGVGAAFPK